MWIELDLYQEVNEIVYFNTSPISLVQFNVELNNATELSEVTAHLCAERFTQYTKTEPYSLSTFPGRRLTMRNTSIKYSYLRWDYAARVFYVSYAKASGVRCTFLSAASPLGSSDSPEDFRSASRRKALFSCEKDTLNYCLHFFYQIADFKGSHGSPPKSECVHIFNDGW